MTTCKLTKPDGSTRGGVVLSAGKEISVSGPLVMCKNGIHYYEHPLLAAFFYPIHVEGYSILWSVDIIGESIRDGQVKSCCYSMRGIDEIPMPEISTEQRVEIGIRCALAVNHSPKFAAWAERWLSGEDRSARAAWWAARAAARAARAAEWAARAAEWAALAVEARAELVAEWAALAAAEAARAGPIAANADDHGREFDVLSIIKSVVCGKGDRENQEEGGRA